jgi:putative transposase
MCRVLRVHRSGYYAWLRQPLSDRAVENRRLLALIRASYEASGCAYGSPRVFLDLREEGETCSLNRVARLMRRHRIKAVRSYRRPRYVAGVPSVVTPDHLEREFTVDEPDRVWVTDITYIRTWEGWLYLAAVMDLYSRKVVGWSEPVNKNETHCCRSLVSNSGDFLPCPCNDLYGCPRTNDLDATSDIG